jgi:hypothetical protein
MIRGRRHLTITLAAQLQPEIRVRDDPCLVIEYQRDHRQTVDPEWLPG